MNTRTTASMPPTGIRSPGMSKLGFMPAWLIIGAVLTLLGLLSACQPSPDEKTYAMLEPPTAAQQSFDYQQDIQPLFDRYCIACHACYDAPCQLKLEAAAGVERGASKIPVYNGARIHEQDPTRLHMDAVDTASWRKRGFFTVLAATEEGRTDTEGALLKRMLELGHANPPPVNEPLPEEYDIGIKRKHVCPQPEAFDAYADDHPYAGMPFAVTPIPDGDYQTLMTWLQQGAVVTPPKVSPTPTIAAAVQRWENYFNRTDKRSQLIARYLFEHLFLAHLYFEDETGFADEAATTDTQPQFFELVRATAAAPAPIVPIASVRTTPRPNDPPGTRFFYRLRPLTDTTVHKTHITYGLSAARMARYQQLFDDTDWEVTELPAYDYTAASNPFLTFAAMPARSRYQFMLDEAEYFTRTFIRGPVCRGQVATDVIRDQFWVMFEAPAAELYGNNSAYRTQVSHLLGLPGQNSRLLDFDEEWDRYNDDRNQYWERRYKQYRGQYPQGPALNQLWNGATDTNSANQESTYNDNALLTVFRHHNSASVRRGWWGQPPRTLWVMDYPLFERTYYELVVNFNVFGNVAHQAQTRLYFDLIRNGGESNFLRFLPPEKRQDVFDYWYQGLADIKEAITYHELDVNTPTTLQYPDSADPRLAFIQQARDYFKLVLNPDSLNQCQRDACKPASAADRRQSATAQLRRLALANAKSAPGIKLLPDVTSLLIETPAGDRQVFQLFRNRAHSNVAFMFGESLRYQPEQDTITVMDFPLSSYPNFLLKAAAKDLPQLISELLAMNDAKALQRFVNRWGVRRTAPTFWQDFHQHSTYMQQQRPIEAGVYDLNRYLGW